MILPIEVKQLKKTRKPMVLKARKPLWLGHAADSCNYRARKAWKAFEPRFEQWMERYNPHGR